jgi:hypothetical protein
MIGNGFPNRAETILQLQPVEPDHLDVEQYAAAIRAQRLSKKLIRRLVKRHLEVAHAQHSPNRRAKRLVVVHDMNESRRCGHCVRHVMSREGSNGKLPFGSLPRLQPKPVIIIRAVNRASALT